MKQEVIKLTGKVDQCNLDLKTARDDVVVKENEKKELQESLEKVSTYIMYVICMYVCRYADIVK